MRRVYTIFCYKMTLQFKTNIYSTYHNVPNTTTAPSHNLLHLFVSCTFPMFTTFVCLFRLILSVLTGCSHKNALAVHSLSKVAPPFTPGALIDLGFLLDVEARAISTFTSLVLPDVIRKICSKSCYVVNSG